MDFPGTALQPWFNLEGISGSPYSPSPQASHAGRPLCDRQSSREQTGQRPCVPPDFMVRLLLMAAECVSGVCIRQVPTPSVTAA
jgi:hypothetical protein